MIRMMVWMIFAVLVTACSKETKEVLVDKDVILVRKIGDEIMKYARDSTSSLKPVTELGARSYMLEFNTPFSFISDSVINIIARQVGVTERSEYVVKVHDCDQRDLIFSYYISPEDNGSLLSCMGREQEKACYLVEIKFLERPWRNGYEALWLVLLLPIIGIGMYFLYRMKPAQEELVEAQLVGVAVGRFLFDFEGQSLTDRGEKQTLTYKESKIMKVLSDRINEVVEREDLSKLVWEDDGIVVGRSLDMFISKLRKKLIADERVQIKNIHGIGYKLMVS